MNLNLGKVTGVKICSFCHGYTNRFHESRVKTNRPTDTTRTFEGEIVYHCTPIIIIPITSCMPRMRSLSQNSRIHNTMSLELTKIQYKVYEQKPHLKCQQYASAARVAFTHKTVINMNSFIKSVLLRQIRSCNFFSLLESSKSKYIRTTKTRNVCRLSFRRNSFTAHSYIFK